MLLAALFGAVGICFVLYRAWVTDDAFITFRYVLNIHAGNGPVFNAGERVQGYTHPLWLWLLAAGGYVVHVYAAAILWGLALSGTTAISLAWFLRRASDRGLWLTLAFVALFSSRTFVEFQTSGLETALTTLLVVSLVGLLGARRPTEPIPYAGASGLCALLLLTRPDHVVLCTPILFALAMQYRRDRRMGNRLGAGSTVGVLAAFLAVAAWYAFATIYYGSPLPNTAYAKVNAPLSVALARGLMYARVYLADEPLHGALMLAGICAGFWAARRDAGQRAIFPTALSTALLLHASYVFAIGGDFMRGRFYLPVLAGSIVLLVHLGAASEWLAGRSSRARLGLALAAVLAVYGAASWIQVLTALVERAGRWLSRDFDAATATSLAPCMLAAFVAALVIAAVIARRSPRHRLLAYGGWLMMNVSFAGGLFFCYPPSVSLWLAGAALLVGSVATGLMSRRGGRTAAMLAGLLAAAVGSLCDLGHREGPYRKTGVTDEWAWYSAKHWTNPFAEPVEFRWAYADSTRELGDALHAYADKFGPLTLGTGGIGILSYHAGLKVRIVDLGGLTDAFIAREHETGLGRVGHPEFDIPTGYLESQGAVELLPRWGERIMNLDPTLAQDAGSLQARSAWNDADGLRRYRSIRLITSGELFDRERWRTMPGFIVPARPNGSPASP